MAGRLCFGPFQLDRTNQRLSREGREIALAPKVFAVLLHLADNAGSLVTKEELLDSVWHGLHVTDGALKRCIAELRKALKDPANEPRYIQTLHGRGYRFLPDTDIQAASAAEPIETQIIVGRKEELRWLGDTLEKAVGGVRQVIFLTGEAGIGKTALVNLFLHRLQSPESASMMVAVCRGRCLPQLGDAEPYRPVFEALDSLSRSLGARLISVLRTHAPTWLLNMPSLISSSDRAQLREEVAGATEGRMLREIADAWEALSGQIPIVLVLEDLHLSDPSTLDLLTVLASRTLPAKLMVIATCRPNHPGAGGAAIGQIQGELRIRSECQVLPVPYLSGEDVQEYVRQRFGRTNPDEAWIETLHRRSTGNPLFMVSLLEHMQSAGLDAGALDTIVPDGVQKMFEHHAGQLMESEQQILEAAVVGGQVFSTAAVAAAVNRSPVEVETVCEALVRRNVLVRRAEPLQAVDGMQSSQYGFVHVLCRESLYRRLAPSQRHSLLDRMGLAAERLHRANPEAVVDGARRFTPGRPAPVEPGRARECAFGPPQ